MKNKYAQETPEWQLFELAESAEHAGNAFAADAERFQLKAKEQRDKAERFRAALVKLSS
jgi:hypothetical protein